MARVFDRLAIRAAGVIFVKAPRSLASALSIVRAVARAVADTVLSALCILCEDAAFECVPSLWRSVVWHSGSSSGVDGATGGGSNASDLCARTLIRVNSKLDEHEGV